jgi:predicted membrane protein
MDFMFRGLFWGAVLILFGICLIINIVFKTDIPFFRIFIALIVIYFGLRILTGGGFLHRHYSYHSRQDNTVIFGKSNAKASGSNQSNEYNTVFGSQTVDLSDILSDSASHNVAINSVFGEEIVFIGKDQNVSAKLSAAFGSVFTPDGNQVSFGELNYRSPDFDSSKPVLHIDANAVFGSVKIVTR